MSGLTEKSEHAGASWDIPDPGDAGTVDVRYSGVCALTSGASAETRTLPQSDYIGQWIGFCFDTDGGGDITLTVTGGFDSGATATAIFTEAGQYIEFTAATVAGARVWRLSANED